MAGRRWGGRHSQKLVSLTLLTYGDRCHLCGTRGATTADHLVPRSKGGTDQLSNLRPAHGACNYSRGNASLDEWRTRTGLGVEGSANRSGRQW